MSRLFWTDERVQSLRRNLKKGKSYRSLARKYGTTVEAVYYARAKYCPDLERRASQHGAHASRNSRVVSKNRDPEFLFRCRTIFRHKKNNVMQKGGIKWTLDIEDVEFPTFCPILGMKLDYSGARVKENSPSFDRVNPKRGYVKGNVIVCSWRANRIKNDGTLREHEKIVAYLRAHKSMVE